MHLLVHRSHGHNNAKDHFYARDGDDQLVNWVGRLHQSGGNGTHLVSPDSTHRTMLIRFTGGYCFILPFGNTMRWTHVRKMDVLGLVGIGMNRIESNQIECGIGLTAIMSP